MTSIVHFEIPADDIQRAKTFYSDLFGWRMESMPGMDYTMIDTFGAPGGGMMKRMHPEQQIIRVCGESGEAGRQDHSSQDVRPWNGLLRGLSGHRE